MILLGVTGRPIAHSASPNLHRAGMVSLGKQGASLRLIADSGKEALALAAHLEMNGFNVTAPFKEEIASLADELSAEASELKAANTVVFRDGKIIAHNTDVYGVKESLKPLILESANKSPAIILGAGGAAKAACLALKDLNIDFTIINRSKKRAAALAENFNAKYFAFEDVASNHAISEAKIIINCLSTLERPFAEGLINKNQIILDAHYKQESKISEEARTKGATLISGFDWLIHQSIEAQKIFLAAKPDFKQLKSSVSSSKPKSIALIGLMGSGKTVVGSGLAAKLKKSFIDLDQQIEQKYGKPIKELFAAEGEVYFRNQESLALLNIDQTEPHILSCGGGVILNQANRQFLRENYCVVWLWADVEALAARITDPDSRPLLQSGSTAGRLKELLLKRKAFYSETADLVIATDSRSQNQVIERIYEEVC